MLINPKTDSHGALVLLVSVYFTPDLFTPFWGAHLIALLIGQIPLDLFLSIPIYPCPSHDCPPPLDSPLVPHLLSPVCFLFEFCSMVFKLCLLCSVIVVMCWLCALWRSCSSACCCMCCVALCSTCKINTFSLVFVKTPRLVGCSRLWCSQCR